MRFLIIIATVLLLGTLGFFAFQKNNSTLTGHLVLENASFNIQMEILETTKYEVKEKNLSIINGFVNGTANDIEISVQSPVWINDFTGTITTQKGKTVLKGKATMVSGEKMNIKNNNGISVKLAFEQGSLESSAFEIKELNVLAHSGLLELAHNIKIKLNNTPVSIKNFEGQVRHHEAPLNTTTFSGKAGVLDVNEKNFIQSLQGD